MKVNIKNLADDDKTFLVSAVLAPFILWWLLTGRKRYGTKGMTHPK